MKPLKPLLYDNEANEGSDPFWPRVADDMIVSGLVIDNVYPEIEAPLEEIFLEVIVDAIELELFDDEEIDDDEDTQ